MSFHMHARASLEARAQTFPPFYKGSKDSLRPIATHGKPRFLDCFRAGHKRTIPFPVYDLYLLCPAAARPARFEVFTGFSQGCAACARADAWSASFWLEQEWSMASRSFHSLYYLSSSEAADRCCLCTLVGVALSGLYTLQC